MSHAQDHRLVADLCQSLERAKGGGKKAGGGGKKGFSCKKTTFPVAGSQITVDSWRFQDWDYKRDDLPTYARGLFTTKRSDNKQEIVIRGYDKFFNVGEVPSTEWQNVLTDTVGPYELSVKENGCIIFISGLEDGTLLVCSKHSTGVRSDVEQSHAMVGEKWVKRHLESRGKSTKDLARVLRQMNVTAVAELCDDTFEEHVLEYPPEMAGLYIHGLNFNLPEFATLSGPEVHQFADTWGFKKAQYLMMQDVAEVKSFLEQCAETGSWDGRDTEGFVVRCKQRSKQDHQGPDWFFKFKFEEPYLMYRQWRECTKAVIAGKQPKYRKHQKVTEEYLLFARRQLAKDPQLAKQYNLNHGIIKMRDDFLAYKGQKGSDIIRQEQNEEGDVVEDVSNIVLVPIATIGCGKTTVATALVKLFDFGHVQNDNIEGQKGRPQRFANQITNEMALHRVVVADRNNHQKRERKQIIDDVSGVVPSAKFVALHYVHEPKWQMLEGIRKVTRERVLERGDNHQTIRAESKGPEEIIGIMEGFLARFQGCDRNSDPDNSFDEVIDLDVAASSLENLETVVTHLYNAYPKLFGNMPTSDDMEDAITFAMQGQVTTKHDLSFNSGSENRAPRQNNTRNQNQGGRQTASPSEKVPTVSDQIKKLEYFSIPIPAKEILPVLQNLFAGSSSTESRMYNQLKGSRRVQSEFHVTLIHKAAANDNQKTWFWYVDAFTQALEGVVNMADTGMQTPRLGPVRVKLERLVWDDKVMAFVVRLLPTESGESWPCANAVAHITVGTANQSIKPKESNDLLARWEAGQDHGIRDKAIAGANVINSQVTPVYQRGRGPTG